MTTTRTVILLGTYLLIATTGLPGLRISRPVAALIGAIAMVVIGGLSPREAYGAIDMQVIVFLLGVLLITSYLEVAGFFEHAAGWIVRRARSRTTLLAATVISSGLLSALFVNDTVCLVVTPLLLAVLRPLGIRPLPYLLGVAMGANVGSAMTPIGNPQNMLIGVSSGVGFAPFVAALALPSLGGLAIVFGVLALIHRDELRGPIAEPSASSHEGMDRPLVVKSLAIFAGALGAWLVGLPMASVAMTGAAVLVVIAGRNPRPFLARVEWSLLLFFAALFIVMRGAATLPIVTSLTGAAAARLTGARLHDAALVSAAMLALSNLVSNVPAVILWRGVVPTVSNPRAIWLVMAMSSTFAGNLTIFGSMANLIVAERAESRGERLGFFDYARAGVPITVLTILLGIGAMELIH